MYLLMQRMIWGLVLPADRCRASPTVAKSIGSLAFSRPVTSMTVCGHSLGGALATLLALDLAASTGFSHPVVYTYASPRTGIPCL
jgi:pimeloyl-ACP methyl ester carboxylesterase